MQINFPMPFPKSLKIIVTFRKRRKESIKIKINRYLFALSMFCLKEMADGNGRQLHPWKTQQNSSLTVKLDLPKWFCGVQRNILLCMYKKEASFWFSKIVSFPLFVYGETTLTLHCKSHSINSLTPVGGLIHCVQWHSLSKLEYGHCFDWSLKLTIHSWNFPISTKMFYELLTMSSFCASCGEGQRLRHVCILYSRECEQIWWRNIVCQLLWLLSDRSEADYEYSA